MIHNMARKKHDPIQDLLAQARHTQILDAATQVFAEKGFHRATIRDVARVAGVADGTIYNYFENKTALLLGLLNRINETEQRGQHMEQAIQGDIGAFVRASSKRVGSCTVSMISAVNVEPLQHRA